MLKARDRDLHLWALENQRALVWTYSVGHLQVQRRVVSRSGGGRRVEAGCRRRGPANQRAQGSMWPAGGGVWATRLGLWRTAGQAPMGAHTGGGVRMGVTSGGDAGVDRVG